MARERTKSRTRQVDIKPRYKDISEVEWDRAYAFYGKSGTGKTTLTGSFPDLLLIDINDQGTDSVKDIKGLKVWSVEDLDELDDVYWWLKTKGHKEFQFVSLDTVTMLQTMKIMDLMGDRLERSGKQAGDWGTMTKKDWGVVSSYMKDQITRFRDLPMGAIFIAQERIFNASDDDEVEHGAIDPEVGPALSPSVKSHLNAAVGVIGQTFIRSRMITKKNEKGRKIEKEKIEYCLRVGPSSLITTKVRKPRSTDLPDLIVDPTYEDLIDIIEGEK